MIGAMLFVLGLLGSAVSGVLWAYGERSLARAKEHRDRSRELLDEAETVRRGLCNGLTCPKCGRRPVVEG